MRIATAALILGMLELTAAAAPESKGAAREFIVEGGRGGYEVVLSPEFVTTFYFPEKVLSAIAADQKSFEIVKMTNSVVVQPVQGVKKDARTNLNVSTEHMQVSIVLRIGKTDEAVSQVTFVRAEEKAAFEEKVKAEVERQVAERARVLDEERKQLAATIDAKVKTQMAQRMLKRFETQSLKAIERTDDNVVVRVTSAAFIGPDVYLRFEIQNREGLRYVLRAVEVQSGKAAVSSVVQVEHSAAVAGTEKVAVVEGKEARAQGVIVIPASQVSGRTIDVRFLEEGKSALVLQGIRLK